jgi:hypothetical protein
MIMDSDGGTQLTNSANMIALVNSRRQPFGADGKTENDDDESP